MSAKKYSLNLSRIEKALADCILQEHYTDIFESGRQLLGAKEEISIVNALCMNIILTSLDLCQNTLGLKKEKALANAFCKTFLSFILNKLGSKRGKLTNALCKKKKIK
ncbi:hypothetical protein C2G38_2202834 [Gigaspora rosea]|uniref:Uncharacterized protein n=1 Tax=Gigaspora rosea TaxID=44941 RepID=A0A397UNG0_9GLOM|nr:hypothetical protein C2G38_2202834 [Gigaspora rosea]